MPIFTLTFCAIILVIYSLDNFIIIPKTETGLEAADAARIKEIVIEETGVTADKIKIVETT